MDVFPFKRFEVMVVADKTCRLQPVNMVVKSAQFPVEIRILVLIPHSVKPDGSYFSVAGQQFRQLAFHEFVVVRIADGCTRSAGTPTGAASRRIVAPPVDERIVEVQFNILPLALVGKLADYILSVRSGVNDVVVGLVRVPHGESFVVARCEADVFCSGAFDGIHPFFGVEVVGIEGVGKFFVFLVIDVFVGHRPFACGKNGIESPVDKYSEFGILKFCPGPEVGFRRRVGRLRLHVEQEG